MSCAAIIVNYRTAALTVGAVQSLAAHPACSEIHVVDNSLQADEAAYLRQHLPAPVKLHVAEDNLGFAGGCNLAFERCHSEYVLLLNPDARLLPHALQKLLACLNEHPGAAAVGPRIFWDDARRFLLPPTTFPGRPEYVFDQLAGRFAALGHLRAALFRRKSLKQWRATRAFPVAALSGGHVLLRRSAVEQAGGLFDPAFFMYWEDSDLMRRLRDAGYALLLEPEATCIHHYDHHPGKDRLISEGWPAYAAKHFAGWGWRAFDRLLGRLKPAATETAGWPVLDLDGGDVAIPVPPILQTGWLLEFSPAPSFVPSMGQFGEGSVATIAATCASHFRGRDYYVRLSPPTDSPSPCLRFVARHAAES
ncbi:MAG: glycosyltransferase family 2 protein [Rhodocyclales bacterium GT-UBC]|nr:MAG: glycosyltransferase family 2 protein [Rhodocyclales bacterium GT-UBC]